MRLRALRLSSSGFEFIAHLQLPISLSMNLYEYVDNTGLHTICFFNNKEIFDYFEVAESEYGLSFYLSHQDFLLLPF